MLTPEWTERAMNKRSSSPSKERKSVLGDRYLSLRSLATYAGMSVRTLRVLLVRRHAPLPHYRIGGKILVRRSEFDQWVAEFRIVRPPLDLDVVVGDVMRGLE
jgi:excisionase family DNA binding protein